MIDSFINWFLVQSALEQIFWVCAIVSSFFFLVQLLLTLVGMDSSDTEVDFDGPDTMDLGGGISLFTVRAFVNFLIGFGWGGLSLYQIFRAHWIVLVGAVLFGLLFVWIIRFLYKNVKRLEYNAAFNIEECVGKTASVYLRIPPKGLGIGKVQISIRGSIHEIDAYSASDMIPTGSKVRVLKVVDGGLLEVEGLA